MNRAQIELEQLRERVMELLRREKRAIHTGDIATRLGVLTHQVHGAMHIPLQRGHAWFHSSEGYSLPPATIDGPTPGQMGIC